MFNNFNDVTSLNFPVFEKSEYSFTACNPTWGLYQVFVRLQNQSYLLHQLYRYLLHFYNSVKDKFSKKYFSAKSINSSKLSYLPIDKFSFKLKYLWNLLNYFQFHILNQVQIISVIKNVFITTSISNIFVVF